MATTDDDYRFPTRESSKDFCLRHGSKVAEACGVTIGDIYISFDGADRPYWDVKIRFKKGKPRPDVSVFPTEINGMKIEYFFSSTHQQVAPAARAESLSVHRSLQDAEANP